MLHYFHCFGPRNVASKVLLDPCCLLLLLLANESVHEADPSSVPPISLNLQSGRNSLLDYVPSVSLLNEAAPRSLKPQDSPNDPSVLEVVRYLFPHLFYGVAVDIVL